MRMSLASRRRQIRRGSLPSVLYSQVRYMHLSMSGRSLTKKEVAKLVWKWYIPTLSVIGGASGCALKSNSDHNKEKAALTAAYSMSHTALTEYREATKEVVGDKKERAIRDKVAENEVESKPLAKDLVTNTGHGNTLCFDKYLGRYFRSDRDFIEKGINKFNHDLLSEGSEPINNLYDILDLEYADVGWDLGYNSDDGLLEVIFTSALVEDEPCLVMSFSNEPRFGFAK